MTLYMGPNTGLLINGLPGEGHYSDLIRMWRWDDFLRQPVVKGRVAALPTSGQAEGDTYIFTGAGANQNRLARWWATGASTPIWEYMPPRLGWRVQVANETTASGQVKTYEFGASGWTEWIVGPRFEPVAAIAYRSTNLVVPHDTLTDLVFDTEVFDSGGCIDVAASNTLITVPATGVYSLFCAADLSSASPNPGICNLRLAMPSGTVVLLVAAPNVAGAANQMAGSGTAYLTAGTQLKMQIYQSSGAEKTSRAFPHANRFGIARLA